jgi:hypothetical protein
VSVESLVSRVGKWVAEWTVEPVVWRLGQLVEDRVRRIGRELPKPPRWLGIVTIAVGGVLSLSAWVIGKDDETASERATAEPERCSDPSEPSDDVQEVVEALDTLGVEYPPVPDESDAREAWRERAVETHPDGGGDAEAFKEAREAWERVETGGELSGWHDDGEVTQT